MRLQKPQFAVRALQTRALFRWLPELEMLVFHVGTTTRMNANAFHSNIMENAETEIRFLRRLSVNGLVRVGSFSF